MSFKCVVKVSGERGWHSNALRFATEEEAAKYAFDLFGRWALVRETKVVDSTDPVNWKWENDKLVPYADK